MEKGKKKIDKKNLVNIKSNFVKSSIIGGDTLKIHQTQFFKKYLKKNGRKTRRKAYKNNKFWGMFDLW